jgi:hypothetical protein
LGIEGAFGYISTLVAISTQRRCLYGTGMSSPSVRMAEGDSAAGDIRELCAVTPAVVSLIPTEFVIMNFFAMASLKS